MTDAVAEGGLARPALDRCIAVPANRFAAEYWGRAALLSPAARLPRGFDDLLSPDAVDELLADRALRTPFLRMAKEGAVLPPARYTASGGLGAEIGDQVSPEKVLAEFVAGATIVLQGLHRSWRPLREFSRQLVADLGHPVQVNAYITPAASRGFDPHYDVHDVFVLQISGEKRWVVHPPVLVHPNVDEPWSGRSAEVAARAAEPPAIDTVLTPGDALYLPRGWIHSATAQGGTTIHVTVGTPAFTRGDVARELMARVLASDALREPLALGVDVGDPAQLAGAMKAASAALLHEVRAAADDGAVATSLGRRFADLVRPEPVRPLAAVERATTLQPGTRIRWRDGLRAQVTADATGAIVRLTGRTLRLPAECGEAVLALPTAGSVAAGVLPGLDEADSLVVARRLLREGVVVEVP